MIKRSDEFSQAIGSRHIERSVRSVLGAFRRPRFRSMAQFAQDEIIIPSGRFESRRFDLDRQPFFRHAYDCVDSGLFSEFVFLGPSQSGKSLGFFVIPIIYHLFEIGESVIAAVPDGEMIRDKWEESILPVIERTRYKRFLPRDGVGSRGGTSLSIKFGNGVKLRWMTAGGRDKSRSNFTARVICMTETDGFDDTFETSDEGTKIAQIEARTFSYDESRRRIYKECTVSRDSKHTWDKYTNSSTSSRLLLPCPHCKHHVLPEREQLQGWQHAVDEQDAREKSLFYCPDCGEAWTDSQRSQANKHAKLVHSGQEIDESGTVAGPAPRTRTLGFRWTAVHNQFAPAGDIGVQEYRAPRSKSPDLEERKVRQFIFCIPLTDETEALELSAEAVERRANRSLGKGAVPDGAGLVGLGVDCGKRLLHWTVSAKTPEGVHVLDYGRIEVPTDELGEEKALRIAFAELYELLESAGIRYDQACVDIRYLPEFVIAAMSALNDERWMPHVGLGDNHYLSKQKYIHPAEKSASVKVIGERFYLKRREKGKRVFACFSDACWYKSFVQKGFHGDAEGERFTLYGSTNAHEHVSYSKHITAEREEVEFVPGKGFVRKWVTLSRSNHWLDATYMSYVAIKVRPKRPKKILIEKRRLLQ